MIDLALVYIAMMIPFGPGAPRIATADVGIFFRVGADLQPFALGGLATPFGYIYDRYTATKNRALHAEEILHIRQWEALGPAFPLAYLVSGGDPFEPYTPVSWQVAPSAERQRGRGVSALERMWQPDARRSPQWRIDLTGGEPRVRFMPLYADWLTHWRHHARPALRSVR
jgi:hypothetical protein